MREKWKIREVKQNIGSDSLPISWIEETGELKVMISSGKADISQLTLIPEG